MRHDGSRWGQAHRRHSCRIHHDVWQTQQLSPLARLSTPPVHSVVVRWPRAPQCSGVSLRLAQAGGGREGEEGEEGEGEEDKDGAGRPHGGVEWGHDVVVR